MENGELVIGSNKRMRAHKKRFGFNDDLKKVDEKLLTSMNHRLNGALDILFWSQKSEK